MSSQQTSQPPKIVQCCYKRAITYVPLDVSCKKTKAEAIKAFKLLKIRIPEPDKLNLYVREAGSHVYFMNAACDDKKNCEKCGWSKLKDRHWEDQIFLEKCSKTEARQHGKVWRFGRWLSRRLVKLPGSIAAIFVAPPREQANQPKNQRTEQTNEQTNQQQNQQTNEQTNEKHEGEKGAKNKGRLIKITGLRSIFPRGKNTSPTNALESERTNTKDNSQDSSGGEQ